MHATDYVITRRISKIFPQGGDLALKQPFLGRFDRSPSYTPTGHGLRFWTSLSLPSIRKGQRCSHPEPTFFVRHTVSAVEAAKVTQFATSQR